MSRVVPRCRLALSTLGGIRTRALRLERPAATPQAYEGISQCVGQELNLHSDCGWVTATWARQCPADTFVPLAQEGFEPSACLFLREAGLPVAYRANLSSGSWNRTNIVSFKARQPTFSRSPRVSGGSRTRLSGMASPCLTARPRTHNNRRHPHKQDSVLGHHFSGHLPDPAIALLTGLGLFGLHPPRSWRYSAPWRFAASLSSGVLTFLRSAA